MRICDMSQLTIEKLRKKHKLTIYWPDGSKYETIIDDTLAAFLKNSGRKIFNYEMALYRLEELSPELFEEDIIKFPLQRAKDLL